MLKNTFARKGSSMILAALVVVCGGRAFAQEQLPAPDSMSTLSVEPVDPNDDAELPIQGEGRDIPVVPAEDGPAVETATATGQATTPRRFRYKLSLTLQGTYDDNVNFSNSAPVSDYYVLVSPRILLGFGDVVNREENYLSLDYRPGFSFYSEQDQYNGMRQYFEGGAQYRLRRLTLNASTSIQLMNGAADRVVQVQGVPLEGVNLDVSGRTDFRIYSYALQASYSLTNRTSVAAGFAGLINDYDELISSRSFGGDFYFSYQYSPKVLVSLGGVAGWTFVDPPTPDQTFQQINMRATYEATGKLSLRASGGVEFRQFDQNARGQYVAPVFEVGADYHPTDGSTIAFTALRRTDNSAVLAGQDYSNTNLMLSVQQRFLRRFTLGLSGGYQMSDYFSTNSGFVATRNDDYYYVQPSVDANITRYWSVGVQYMHAINDSSSTPFSFKDNQVSVRSTLTF